MDTSPEVLPENNRKISITIGFAPPEKIPGRKPVLNPIACGGRKAEAQVAKFMAMQEFRKTEI